MEKERIIIEFKGNKIVADIIPKGVQPEILFMHGAGSSNREPFEPMRQLLAEKGIPSCALDFLGHGETGGSMHDSGLRSRTEQAQLVINESNIRQPLVLIGGSMGCYNAIKLTEIYPVKLLVLSAPAVYSVKLYDIPFSEKFTSFIHEPRSWDSTDAWGILNKYKGKLLILSGGQDEIIPYEIIQKIYNSATSVSYREIINYPEADHGIIKKYLNNNPEELEAVVEKIINILQ